MKLKGTFMSMSKSIIFLLNCFVIIFCNEINSMDHHIQQCYNKSQIIHNADSGVSSMEMILKPGQITRIIATGNATLSLSQVGDDALESASIEANDKSVQGFLLFVTDNKLTIGPKRESNNSCAHYSIGLKNISEVLLKNIVRATLATNIKSKNLILGLEHNASFASNNNTFTVRNLDVKAFDDSIIDVAGVARNQRLSLFDNAQYNGQNLKVHELSIQALHASKAKLLFEDAPGKYFGPIRSGISGTLFNTSEVKYMGNPVTSNLECTRLAWFERIG